MVSDKNKPIQISKAILSVNNFSVYLMNEHEKYFRQEQLKI